MIIGVDASNIRGGGGVTHLVELLKAADPKSKGIEKVCLWAGGNTLSAVENRPWLSKISHEYLDRSLFHRIYWQKFLLSELARKEGCDILFVPGGTFSGKFRPFVSMSQNLLPFEPKEMGRYGISKTSFRLLLLYFTQSSAFRRADGNIFLTDFARSRVLRKVPLLLEKTKVVNHGINPKFFSKPSVQRNISDFDGSKPFEILYVSFVGEYKHQWNVVEAVRILKEKGFPVRLTLIGSPDEPKAVSKLRKSIEKADPEKKYILYLDKVTYSEIQRYYQKTNLFAFASSCETFGQIVTEAMASGCPIACSEMSAMPEILGDAGLYFNPLDPISIERVLERMILSEELRRDLAKIAFERAGTFSWKKAADETFDFLVKIRREFTA
ncbi:glycosyltransferase family 1 protein [Leptospira fluminis]|uniref:Glycosyltransferase family 1 protein n=1 Tax=Leptospira fluminis TaxID=2484979 RepID=A0A4R9GNY2_9LEPT|nr:glycosyltransferase family 1 protein [Leptospira fluminis]TGK17283.1 glycosyltransferase family 1 protein [Leptospira fluminis]